MVTFELLQLHYIATLSGFQSSYASKVFDSFLKFSQGVYQTEVEANVYGSLYYATISNEMSYYHNKLAITRKTYLNQNWFTACVLGCS